MAEAYSGVTNGGYGDVKCYVSAWIESYTDKQAVVKVYGAVLGNSTYGPWGFGVRNRVGIDGVGSQDATGWLNYGNWVAETTYSATVNRDGGKWIRCSTSFWGETVSGYGAYPYRNDVGVDLYVEPQVLRPPSAPSGLVARRTSAGVIGLSWSNNATNAASTLVERRPYAGEWQKITDKAAGFSSYVDSVGTGTYRYRVRHWNGDGFSGYSNESEWVTALCAPAAPALVLPASGATLDANGGAPTLVWRHNGLDTSAQTAAQVRFTRDGWASKEEASVAGEGCSVSVGNPGNADVEWKVRTKGAYDGDGDAEAAWSPWSAVGLFKVRTPPSVSVSVGEPVTSVPVKVTWAYDDAQGTQASALVSIADASGATVCERLVDSPENGVELDPASFTPTNGQRYIATVTACSTTSLQGSGSTSFSVAYAPPGEPSCALSVDEDAARVRVTVFAGEGEASVASLGVFRDGLLVAEGLSSGSTCVDEAPPLDRTVTYRVVAYAPSGAVAECERKTTVPSGGYAFFGFGDDFCRMALNLTMDDQREGESVSRIVASMKHPKVFFGEHESRTGSVSASVLVEDALQQGGRSLLAAAKRLQAYNGCVRMRLPFGDSLLVLCKTKISRSASSDRLASVSVSWEEVGI